MFDSAWIGAALRMRLRMHFGIFLNGVHQPLLFHLWRLSITILRDVKAWNWLNEQHHKKTVAPNFTISATVALG